MSPTRRVARRGLRQESHPAARSAAAGSVVWRSPGPPTATAPSGAAMSSDPDGIPRSRDNPELCWVNDTKIVSNLIAVITPVLGHLLAQEGQHRGAELLEGSVALVVGDVPVHQSP